VHHEISRQKMQKKVSHKYFQEKLVAGEGLEPPTRGLW